MNRLRTIHFGRHEMHLIFSFEYQVDMAGIASARHLTPVAAIFFDAFFRVLLKPSPGATWATILLIFLFLTITGCIIYVIHHIRSIHRKHNEVLAAFLSIIGKQEITQSLLEKSIKIDEESEDFIKKLTEYISENLSNPELSVEDIARRIPVEGAHPKGRHHACQPEVFVGV